ncbi:MAG: glycosyltransferase family 2 protein [Chitinispirillaceae bacterium]|nr:glycosyltransferase family 2 protein [Chitinispirillaceae bacterium]
MAARAIHYAVITPVKNEERYIAQTIASMISQRARPVAWTIVDDASTDDTARIVREYAGNNPWIRYLLYPGETTRKTGSAEILAFDYGMKSLDGLETDYIVKLDGDLRFGEEYFETLLSRFESDKKLGIASGIYFEETAHSWEPVTMPGYHAAGASKVVRRECFEQIHGFVALRGWDTIDEIRAQAAGWKTAHFPDIRFFHLRKEGVGMGRVHTNVMHGEIFYRTGGSFMFFIIKALHRMARGKPILVAGAAMIYGYLAAAFRKESLLVSPTEARNYRQLLSRRMGDGVRRILPFRVGV